jgi:class 3 adenylate cyclase/streptogramin lyase
VADLPRGAVTFLFTDIEGSTRLVKQLRDRYGEVLAEHQRLLRKAFAQHGGYELDTQGDAFFVAFASARDAVLAAVAAQRAVSGYPWPDGASVRVRMGVHTGQASPVDGRYTGIAVHRAARICAAGHGGQVLVSQATQTLLEDEEEDLAVALRDLGAQRLKDLDRPVHLYQVGGPGLQADFPPLRGEGEAHAPAVAPPLPVFRRRTAVLVAAGIGALAAAALTIVLTTRGGGGGLAGVHANNVGVIDARTGRIVAEIPVGVRPGPVATGGGSVWVGNTADRTLTRIGAKTHAVASTVSLNRQTPTGIAYGEGAVWVAHGILGRLSRVDPQFGEVKTIDLAGASSSGTVAVGGGSVWAVYGESTLAQVSPALTKLGVGVAGTRPAGIVYADQSLWVVNGGEQTVSRFNPDTFEEGPIRSPSVGQQPAGIAAGANAIWVANTADDTVTRIDGSTYAVSTIPVGDRPTAVAVGDGAVWVANSGGTVSRIDPARHVVKTIDLGNAPAGIAVGDGLVWVSVRTP